MDLEHPDKAKKKDAAKAGPGMSRRQFLDKLKDAAIYGAIAAPGLAAMTGGVIYADKRQPALDAEHAIDKEHTHIGKAIILNKIEKDGGQHPTPSELVNGALSGYGLGGVSGSLMMLSNIISTGAMDTGRDYYLVVKVDDKEPFVMRTVPIEYKNSNIGDIVEAEYVMDEKEEQIKRVNLNPRH